MKLKIITLVSGLLLSVSAFSQLNGTEEVEAISAEMSQIASSIIDATATLTLSETLMGTDNTAKLSYSLEEEQRLNWQYWPAPRIGLPLDEMEREERMLTHALLQSALSTAGYLKATNIMQLERVLDMIESNGLDRSVDHYTLSIFGTPSTTSAWAWRFEGHHVSLSTVVTPDGVRVTPSFFGSNPAQVLSGPMTGLRIHGKLEDTARQLVQSLDSGQQQIAIVADVAPSEIFTGNIGKPVEQWETWRETLMPQGILVGGLNDMQQEWVDRILEEVLGNYEPALANQYWRELDPASLRFAWMGPTERGALHYFRIQGDAFLFEFDNTQDGGNHVHSVWHDRNSNFGEDLLGEHYQAAHMD